MRRARRSINAIDARQFDLFGDRTASPAPPAPGKRPDAVRDTYEAKVLAAIATRLDMLWDELARPR